MPEISCVIVSVETLSCFDCLVWLGTGENAARRLGVDQATIARTARKVAYIFDLTLQKQSGEWQIVGDRSLLDLERRSHRVYRWQMNLPLRVEAQYTSGPLFLEPSPDGWLAGNFDFVEVATPLDHLRSGVIDAWIGCHPDVPEDDDAEAAPLRVQPLVDIMNHAEPAEEGALLEGLRGRDEGLADEVRAKLLSFEDVPRVQDRDLQQLLRGVDLGVLALALKGAPEDIASAITANMSERNRESLAEEAAELGRVPRRQVEEARNAVVRALRELAGTAGLELKSAGAEGAGEQPSADPAEPEEEYVD